MVVYEVARGFSGGQEFATSINVANEDSVTGVTELGVQPASLYRYDRRGYKLRRSNVPRVGFRAVCRLQRVKSTKCTRRVVCRVFERSLQLSKYIV